jgi:DNA sulfur modification protein DndB
MNDRLNFDVFSYTFPVIRGVQSGREYYVAMIPLKIVPSLFMFNDERLPPEMRAQRLLNKSRVPSITRYLVENVDNYTFSSLTASIDRMVEFVPIPQNDPNSKIGYITIPAETRIIINDGQHRRAAITEAIKQQPDLAYETISVVLYIDTGLERSQQMFSDLNRFASKPSGSINILYDNRDEFARLVLELINEVPIFKDNVDFEKTSISNRSRKLFTLSSIYRANKSLLDSIIGSKEYLKQIASEFWNEITIYMRPWNDFQHVKPAYILRKETIAVHDLTLQSIAILGSYLLRTYPGTWKDKIVLLDKIDWSRNNPEWNERALISGRLRKSHANVVLTANILKIKLGIPLSPKEQEYETRLTR